MRARRREKGIDTGYDPDPLRILHVSTPMSWRGGEQQLAYLFSYLDRCDLQQCVLTAEGSALASYCQERGWPFTTFSRKGMLASGVAWELKRLVKAYAPDLVHVHDAHAHTAAFISTLLFGMRVPVIVHRRVDFPVGKNFFSRWKYDHSSVARVIAISEAIRRIGEEGVKMKEKWTLVHDGIDPEAVQSRKDPGRIRAELGVGSDTPVIGNVAALADHKDHITFLRTARSYIDQGGSGHFVIVGEGPERGSVEEELVRLGLQDRVSMLGFRKDAFELMSGFDVLLMSSKTEGLGTSILDAMACGIPVVATNAGGIPEILEDKMNGLLRNVRDHEGLAGALFDILRDKALQNELVAEGERTATSFSYQRMGEEVLQIYRSVLQGLR